MMDWIKSLGASVWVGVLGFFTAMAVFAAKRQAKTADKWRDRAVDIETGRVTDNIETAKAAMTQAKRHEAKAEEIRKQANDRLSKMAERDEEVADVLDRWRRS